jgi:hypothetical protein
VKNIQNIVNDLEKELKIGTKLEIIIKKKQKIRICLIVLFNLTSLTIIGEINTLSSGVIHQNVMDASRTFNVIF